MEVSSGVLENEQRAMIIIPKSYRFLMRQNTLLTLFDAGFFVSPLS